MVSCNHESCGREKRVWLPTGKQNVSEVVLHPWCEHCGLVKNISDDRPHGIGYWMNILSNISKIFSLKKVQKHMICKELESNDCFDDLYGITGSAQKELFNKILEKYCNINMQCIDSSGY